MEEHVPLESVILLDDLCVHIWHKEQGGHESHTCTRAHGDCSNIGWRLLVETKVGGPLVHDGQGTDGGSDKEKEW